MQPSQIGMYCVQLSGRGVSVSLDAVSRIQGSSPVCVTVLFSWLIHLTLSLPYSCTQVYKWVPANLMLGECFDGLGLRPGGIEIFLFASCYRRSSLIRHLALLQTYLAYLVLQKSWRYIHFQNLTSNLSSTQTQTIHLADFKQFCYYALWWKYNSGVLKLVVLFFNCTTLWFSLGVITLYKSQLRTVASQLTASG